MFDLTGISQLRSELSAFLEIFDPETVPAAALPLALDDAVAVSNMVTLLVTSLSGRAAEISSHLDHGARSAAHHIAHQMGTTITEANRTLEAAQRLKTCPATHAAAARGTLSARQIGMIAEAAETNPAAEESLLAVAQGTSSFSELADACAAAKAAVKDDETIRREAYARRSLRGFPDTDGGYRIHFTHTSAVAAQLMATIENVAETYFEKARAAKKPEAPEAYRADALVEIVSRFADATWSSDSRTNARPESRPENRTKGQIERRAACPDDAVVRARRFRDTKVIVRVDHSALVRGSTGEGEVCEIVGVGPVARSVVEEILASGDAFLSALITKGTDVVNVVHLGRRATAIQKTALQWLYPTCAVSGCSGRSHLEIDHRVDWARSQVTTLPALDLLCSYHHMLKTTANWALVHGTGKRVFVPPDDPRHPDRGDHPNQPDRVDRAVRADGPHPSTRATGPPAASTPAAVRPRAGPPVAA